MNKKSRGEILLDDYERFNAVFNEVLEKSSRDLARKERALNKKLAEDGFDAVSEFKKKNRKLAKFGELWIRKKEGSFDINDFEDEPDKTYEFEWPPKSKFGELRVRQGDGSLKSYNFKKPQFGHFLVEKDNSIRNIAVQIKLRIEEESWVYFVWDQIDVSENLY